MFFFFIAACQLCSVINFFFQILSYPQNRSCVRMVNSIISLYFYNTSVSYSIFVVVLNKTFNSNKIRPLFMFLSNHGSRSRTCPSVQRHYNILTFVMFYELLELNMDKNKIRFSSLPATYYSLIRFNLYRIQRHMR